MPQFQRTQIDGTNGDQILVSLPPVNFIYSDCICLCRYLLTVFGKKVILLFSYSNSLQEVRQSVY